jgi:hypothetical protein
VNGSPTLERLRWTRPAEGSPTLERRRALLVGTATPGRLCRDCPAPFSLKCRRKKVSMTTHSFWVPFSLSLCSGCWYEKSVCKQNLQNGTQSTIQLLSIRIQYCSFHPCVEKLKVKCLNSYTAAREGKAHETNLHLDAQRATSIG